MASAKVVVNGRKVPEWAVREAAGKSDVVSGHSMGWQVRFVRRTEEDAKAAMAQFATDVEQLLAAAPLQGEEEK